MIQKLLEERVSAILLRPKGVKTWTPPVLFRTLAVLENHSLSGSKIMVSLGAQPSPGASQVMHKTHMFAHLGVLLRTY